MFFYRVPFAFFLTFLLIYSIASWFIMTAAPFTWRRSRTLGRTFGTSASAWQPISRTELARQCGLGVASIESATRGEVPLTEDCPPLLVHTLFGFRGAGEVVHITSDSECGEEHLLACLHIVCDIPLEGLVVLVGIRACRMAIVHFNPQSGPESCHRSVVSQLRTVVYLFRRIVCLLGLLVLGTSRVPSIPQLCAELGCRLVDIHVTQCGASWADLPLEDFAHLLFGSFLLLVRLRFESPSGAGLLPNFVGRGLALGEGISDHFVGMCLGLLETSPVMRVTAS